ncbi:outer membrane lipoprotein carrier protein LolA [Pantoea latae]|uniref:Outer membrane lipoprotein carrier protein LolA n=1 Tax=Pantoea latae TaxID=1964541 RepID=A0A1V9DPE6_9GAMM|nr:outer membrane lipoprotein carrier protein LolA [Pantoea latae]OQP35717.1 hypothetical protein B2J69_01605 [Pantoea latae]
MLKYLLAALLLATHAAGAVTLAQLQERFASQPVIRADFTQTRQIAGMAQPLTSRGELLIAQQQGLWWHQRAPFSMTLLLDDKRMVQILNGQPPQVVTAEANPQMFQFNHLLRALFEADARVLQENFTLDFQAKGDARWTLALTPKAPPLNKIFTRIDLAGDTFLQQIDLKDTQGDRTHIELSNTRTQPPQLSAEERARFAP